MSIKFGLSKSFGDISHEKTMSVASAATMVVVPDADGQHEQIVQNVVDGGLKARMITKPYFNKIIYKI